ncbi:thioesterase family protein [Flammeovirgaceae bacterium SG7u.111]|nr:thioesterase family protein [Flammeovirgaceae bacterium SG7u.132]WPO35412.1 thioesterase family protein [Flammeovirgaceae bacterium SG7u.111]
MFSYDYQLRIRYADTDQMGFVYYGNYASFYEIGRVESLRSLGLSYSELEATGVIMPVLECYSKFIRPALYDQLITIRTIIKELPSSRIYFEYEIYNEAEELINIGKTTLVFVDQKTKKPCVPPHEIMDALKPHLEV